tara:strand:- start:405 stop:830 length:426 start_codon:yes stop_codon:yes gene_type:complete
MNSIKQLIIHIKCYLKKSYLDILKQDSQLKDDLINQLCDITNLIYDDIYQYIEDSTIFLSNNNSTIKIQVNELYKILNDESEINKMKNIILDKYKILNDEIKLDCCYRSSLYLLRKNNIKVNENLTKEDIIKLYSDYKNKI